MDKKSLSEGDNKLVEKAANLAYEYQEKYRGCSQCVLKALEDSLGLDSGLALKATTALSGGVAMMGESCGALLGGVVAIGLAFGRERLEEGWWTSRGYTEAHYYAAELCDRFKEELGSTKCRDILKARLGSFDLRKKEAVRRLISAGALSCCPEIVRKAAQLAAEIILQAK